MEFCYYCGGTAHEKNNEGIWVCENHKKTSVKKHSWGFSRADIEKVAKLIPTGKFISNKEAIAKIMRGANVSRVDAEALLLEMYRRPQFDMQGGKGYLEGDILIHDYYRFILKG